MSSVQVEAINADSNDIPFQEASLDIWDKKYRLKSKNGDAIDATMVEELHAVCAHLERHPKVLILSGTEVNGKGIFASGADIAQLRERAPFWRKDLLADGGGRWR